MAKKIYTTYIVSATGGQYDLNQDYYYRTETEAKDKAIALKEWFKDIPTQKIEITSHTWSNV